MKRRILFGFFLLFFLTGCWNNQDINNAAFVHGIGLDQSENQIKASVEIVKPSSGQPGETSGKNSGQNMILEIKADTLLEAARELIRTAKRRLDFSHTAVYIISEDLAKKEDFPLALDIFRRDQMLRLSSYLFVSEGDPIEVFQTPTLYENLSSTELVSSIETARYISESTPMNLYEFYRFLHDHHDNAYLPIISVQDSVDQKVTTFKGAAVIKDNQMVGKLNIKEATGLNWLLNQVKGGTITTILGKSERASVEINKVKTKINPVLKGNQLKVDVQTKVEGTLADSMSTESINEAYLKRVEKEISDEIKGLMLASLQKQQELETDLTDFGRTLYQRSPNEWKKVTEQWDDIFSQADVKIHVDTNITHPGLLHESLHQHQPKPDQNPYRYLMSLFSR